ncbi:hypothetical protein HD554DRAFT_2177770 [Boletus coccyginus]|nr:hypothetical protein HD554DRAFT_2177770 [Boletus coccyginus]
MTSPSSSIHQHLLQPLPIHPVQFPLRNTSSPLISLGLTYLPKLNHGLTVMSITDDHGLTSRTPLNESPLTNISNGFSIPSLLLENNTVVSSNDIAVDKNVDSNDMVFIIDEIMESGEIIDLDQAMNLLQIDLTLNNRLVMSPKDVHAPMRIQRHQTISYRNNQMHQIILYKNIPDLLIRLEVPLVRINARNPLDISSHLAQIVQIPTLYHDDLLPQVVVEEGPV